MVGQLLFVYGSMAEGMVHFDKLKDFIISVKPAWARGTVYRLKIGYPAMIEVGNDPIAGNLVELKSSEIFWHLLDGFYGFNQLEPEKSLYLRQSISVLLEGSVVQSWAYVLPPQKIPIHAEVIPGGDWKWALKDQPPLLDKLTEKQKNYVLKLGGSSGREIVPIDLNLYRELMSLELIIDKGRRLALTRLGQEIYHHLR